MTNFEYLSGRLTKSGFGQSMPVDSPYYHAPPYHFRDARAITVYYETDGEAAATFLPEGVEVTSIVQVKASVVHYPNSSFGSYNEAMLTIPCFYRDQPEGKLTEYDYLHAIVLDSTMPLVAGRELWGYPKKPACVSLVSEDELFLATVERPRGMRILTASMRRDELLPVSGPQPFTPVLSLRVIPDVESDTPALAELIATEVSELVIHEFWRGPATLSYDARSALDPWHALPINQILYGAYLRYDLTVPRGRVLHRY